MVAAITNHPQNPSDEGQATTISRVSSLAATTLSKICDKHYGIFHETIFIKELILCMLHYVKFITLCLRLCNICFWYCTMCNVINIVNLIKVRNYTVGYFRKIL
jgi:hypothetical protein